MPGKAFVADLATFVAGLIALEPSSLGAQITPAERHRAMRWSQRLQRVFRLEMETCEHCSGLVQVIASIADPAVIGRILAHLESGASGSADPPRDGIAALRARRPPGQGMLALA